MERIVTTRPKPSRLLTLVAAIMAVQVGVATQADAGARASCESLVRKAGRRGVESAMRCIAGEKRRGVEHAPECLAKSTNALSAKMSRRGGACAPETPAITSVLTRCVETVLAEIPGTGRCAARRVAAARAHLRFAIRSVESNASTSRSLCRAFERAGTCDGECGAVEAALSACAGDLLGSAPPDPRLPLPAPGDEIILFGAYEGEAISTATVVGQDEVTGTVRVVIEPGTSRLYVVLAGFEATIWRFEGATARVGHVVLLGAHSQGVTGVAAELVTDMTGTTGDLGSAYFYDVQLPEAVAIRDAVERALGRTVDVFGASYAVGTLSLPSAAVEHGSPTFGDPPPGYDFFLYLFATFFRPGGIVEVDPADVVPLGAESYVVPPLEFGLAQLVASGALTNEGGPLGGYFYIAAPIARFPAGLYGAHSVTFVLGIGVPLPPGDPGHSCVISEETGLPLVESFLCWNIQPPSDCTLPEADAEDQVVLFGGYDGDAISTVSIVGQDDVTGTARVVVESGSKPLYVILSSYESMIWRFEGATERMRRVVLIGRSPQAVTGLLPDTVIDTTDTVQCFWPFYDVQSPEGVLARGAVERVLERPVDVFGASYGIGILSLPGATVDHATPTPGVVPAGLDPALYEAALRFNPAGVVEIDPAVVGPSGAEPYEVLPHQFGLAQLVGSGAVEYEDTFPFWTFYIRAPIARFPAGLHGAHAVVFVLAPDVPLPAGDPGHSCVIAEETGLPIVDGGLCGFRDIIGPAESAGELALTSVGTS